MKLFKQLIKNIKAELQGNTIPEPKRINHVAIVSSKGRTQAYLNGVKIKGIGDYTMEFWSNDTCLNIMDEKLNSKKGKS